LHQGCSLFGSYTIQGQYRCMLYLDLRDRTAGQ
jgi:hypothetical protein